MDEVELKVEKAYPNDRDNGAVRLDPGTLLELQLSPGDFVAIAGDATTAASAWRLDNEERGEGTIRLDRTLRKNAGVSLGDLVSVRKVTPDDATHIELAPTAETSIPMTPSIVKV